MCGAAQGFAGPMWQTPHSVHRVLASRRKETSVALTTIAFVISFLAGCLLAFVRHPIWGLVTYVGVFYLHPPSRWWGEGIEGVRWSLLAALLTLGAVMIRKPKSEGFPVFSHGIMVGLLIFVVWACIQSFWVLDLDLHLELVVLVIKYLMLVVLIYKCVDSERHMRFFLWAHVLGCFYLGWIVFTEYTGGRFEGFGGPGISDANTGAMQIVTGIMIGSSLMLAGGAIDKAGVVAAMPFIVNALIATVSRSGALAAAVGGVVFNLLTPKRFRRVVRVLSLLAIVLFVMLTNPTFWTRMETLKQAGADIENVDTGFGRLVIIKAQWRMFRDHPMGCGHRCTEILSPQYMPAENLAQQGARSSHNTFMTMLVEHGLPGAAFYVAMVAWSLRVVFRLARRFRNDDGFLARVFPSVAAGLAAIFVGDVFVDYLKLEVRIWLLALLVLLVDMSGIRRPVPATGGLSGPVR